VKRGLGDGRLDRRAQPPLVHPLPVAVEDVLAARGVLVHVTLQAVGEQPAARERTAAAMAMSVVASVGCHAPPA
jgi:hypothetical protein